MLGDLERDQRGRCRWRRGPRDVAGKWVASWRAETLTLMCMSAPPCRWPATAQWRRRLEDPPAERDDEPVGLGDRDEAVGRQASAHRVLPADEGLDAEDAPGLEVDDRLVLEEQLVALQRQAELAAELQALDELLAHRRLEARDPAPAASLAEYIASRRSEDVVGGAWGPGPQPMLAERRAGARRDGGGRARRGCARRLRGSAGPERSSSRTANSSPPTRGGVLGAQPGRHRWAVARSSRRRRHGRGCR